MIQLKTIMLWVATSTFTAWRKIQSTRAVVTNCIAGSTGVLGSDGRGLGMADMLMRNWVPHGVREGGRALRYTRTGIEIH